jgi:hypothetical protein
MLLDINARRPRGDSFGVRRSPFFPSLLTATNARQRMTRKLFLTLLAFSFASSGLFADGDTINTFASTNAPQALSAQTNAAFVKYFRETEGALAKVHDYTTIFHRIEMIDGRLIPEEVSLLKFRRPMSVYMKWFHPTKGQETLYVAGANNNKVRAHGTGFSGIVTVNLDPYGARAMQNSRHPVTDIGVHHLVLTIVSNMNRAINAGEMTSLDHGEKNVYGRKTRQLEGILPKNASKGYYCYRCVVNLDLENKMPIFTQIFDWNNRLVESYGYENLQVNPGLTDKDFDPKNSDYNF